MQRPRTAVNLRELARRPSMWVAVGLVLFGIVEVSGLAIRIASVPSKDDYRSAAEYVRGSLAPHDVVVAAPGWADPLLREAAGSMITYEMAGFSDLAAFERLWVVSIRGADFEGAPSRTSASSRSFGGVRVQRWDLGPSSVRDSLVPKVVAARVAIVRPSGETECRLERSRQTRGGGLGTGPMQPRERFVCPGGAWIGRTINEDLSLEPRDCIYQPALGVDPLRVTIADVELGERFVFYGGLYAEAERMEDHAPIDVVAYVDGAEIGRFTHHDGEGWTRHEWATRPGRGSVSIDVTSQNPDRRMFCWSATTRGPARNEAE
jgi:hypothetical protein